MSWRAAAVLCLAALATHARAQSGSESSVGYIDPATVANRFRLRADLGYDNPAPDRGEFGYSRSAIPPGGSAARRADFRELAAYLEIALDERLSVSAELPLRYINPTDDTNAAGPGDVAAAVKYAFLLDEDFVASAQLRFLAPSGNVRQHLGSGHATAEPSLLAFARLADGLFAEGEARLWVPLGADANYSSHVLRYGVGVSGVAWRGQGVTVSPVVELVAWTFLDGRKSVNLPDGTGVVVDAGGDTVANVKLGVRFRTDAGEFYVGYGRAITGEPFYRDLVRAEYRVSW